MSVPEEGIRGSGRLSPVSLSLAHHPGVNCSYGTNVTLTILHINYPFTRIESHGMSIMAINLLCRCTQIFASLPDTTLAGSSVPIIIIGGCHPEEEKTREQSAV